MGPQGPTGPTGPQGPAGAMGPQGPTGPQACRSLSVLWGLKVLLVPKGAMGPTGKTEKYTPPKKYHIKTSINLKFALNISIA